MKKTFHDNKESGFILITVVLMIVVLSLIGITGTNGKTTTSFIVKNIIEAGGKKAGLLGTISYMTGEKSKAALNTTPESLDLQRYLNEIARNKMEYAVLEVSRSNREGLWRKEPVYAQATRHR